MNEEKKQNTPIILGADENAEYVAYGDESGIDDIYLSYAFIIIKRSDIPLVETKMQELKKHYKTPHDVELHFSKLFSIHQRNKLGLNHITTTKLESLIKRLIFILNQTPIFLTYAFCNFKEYKSEFDKFNPKFQDDNINNFPFMHNDPQPKGIQAFMAAYCIQAKPDHSIPSAEKCQIILSKESTLTRLFGKQKKQANNWVKMRIDDYELHPYILESKISPMLQVSDMATYMCVQAKYGNGTKATFFQKQLQSIQHRKESELFFQP